MRDEYDDKYSEAMHKIDFSCSMVLSLKKQFFGTGLNKYIEDNVIRHLLTCKECRRIYSDYAKEVGYKKFNLITYAIKFCEHNKDFSSSKTREYLSEVQDNKTVRIHSRLWTRAAVNFDIEKLMNMRAFRDLSREYNSPTGLDYSEFIKHVTLKIAKRIDHLEECLLKSEEVEINEKSK